MSRLPMPALFLGHGSPMNALEHTPISQSWRELGQTLPKPRAILMISAHWNTRGTLVTAAPKPETIHDFGGFPDTLYAMQYPAPGAPELAAQIATLLPNCSLDKTRGLDHGAWSLLVHLYPEADVPILQLSLDMQLKPEQEYGTGRALRTLREQGVLIIGSGNTVHNLRALVAGDGAYPWASAFNGAIGQKLLDKADDAVLNYTNLVDGDTARLCHPTDEHLRPLFYVLGTGYPDEPRALFNNQLTMGAISMLSLKLG
ncbi:4,5-DOPA dioxygenase extradiol [Shewanella litorisediminis]|uniref:4,5-DOPA dioxygenase extradiol n=1 Tax=Shewanella litorisediminis TaxID=1173586 RepID=A0ABX7G4W2_9GAMM|nr:4,5-DOPA dioxygenase extradiol [Shewanella litorisediminis]MCL2917770.1 4,5-DOPA dioxygenase extradiol [Shewanella litorisediminis]QRH02213.1 4,5-DOPA dioxygenase extradiol [Shewanella litorisediminis]